MVEPRAGVRSDMCDEFDIGDGAGLENLGHHFLEGVVWGGS